MKFNTGDKVIVRSNEEEPVLIGKFQFYSSECHGVPVVMVGTENLYCMALVYPYSDELLKTLQDMGGKEGWHWLVEQKNQSK